jgi:hypothetical protein
LPVYGAELYIPEIRNLDRLSGFRGQAYYLGKGFHAEFFT